MRSYDSPTPSTALSRCCSPVPAAGSAAATTTFACSRGTAQAEHHTDAGIVVGACDHLHVSDRSHPDTVDLTYENLAAANRPAPTGAAAT